jgi:DNA-binding SARP family transcriptional activator
MVRLEWRTFGFPEFRIDGRAGHLALRKAVALLTYLADADGPVARDTMATLLWSDCDRETALARLRRLLYRIEAALGTTLLDADRIALRWAPAVQVVIDSRAFERAGDAGDFEEAQRTYRNDFLEGFQSGSAGFDQWAFHRREALRGRLIHDLERLVASRIAAGDYVAAAESARRLVGLDPLSEVYARYLMRSLLLAGDRAAAERHYAALAERLGEELGVAPEAETRAAIAAPTHADVPQATRYVPGKGGHLAYQVHGSLGPDILVMPGFVSSVERLWELPACRSFLSALMTIGRVIVFDPRGIGLSDRGSAPAPDAMLEDIDTVLRAAGSRRVVLFGASQCGAGCIQFAAAHPTRVAGLVLMGALAKGSRSPDYPHALTADQFDKWRRQLIAGWGGPLGIETFGPSLAGDPHARAWWAGLLRAASSPGALAAVLDSVRDVDVRTVLPRVSVPTLVLHRRHDRAVPIAAGRYIAEHLPGARLVELDGGDHWFFGGSQKPVVDAVRRFVAGLGRGRRIGSARAT